MSEHKISMAQVALTLTISLASSLITFAGTVATLDTERDIAKQDTQQKLIERLEARVDALHTDIEAAEAKYEVLSKRLELCQRGLSEATLPPIGALKSALEAIPGPAWIKRAVPQDNGRTQFEMLMVNAAYERRYGVTERYYRGRTDFEVWPEAVAKASHEEDLYVYALRTRRRNSMALPANPHREPGPDNPAIPTEIWRGVVELPGGEWGVLGINTQAPVSGDLFMSAGSRFAHKEPKR